MENNQSADDWGEIDHESERTFNQVRGRERRGKKCNDCRPGNRYTRQKTRNADWSSSSGRHPGFYSFFFYIYLISLPSPFLPPFIHSCFFVYNKTHTHEKLLGGRCSCKNEEVRDATSSLRVGTLLSSGCSSAWIIHACFVGSRPVALCASACGRSVWVPPPVIESMGMAPGGSE